MEFLEMFYNMIPEGEEGKVHLLTVKDEVTYSNQEEDLNEIVDNFEPTKLKFTFELKDKDTSHARSIITDTGWKISLDRGLDIFQYFDFSKFNLATRIQEERLCRKFEVTYLRLENN